MNISDIRHLTNGELQGLLHENRVYLKNLRYQHTITPVENPARIRGLKRDIARILTIMTERSNSIR